MFIADTSGGGDVLDSILTRFIAGKTAQGTLLTMFIVGTSGRRDVPAIIRTLFFGMYPSLFS